MENTQQTTPIEALRDAQANLPMTTVNNVTSDALVAQARAAVEARYIMAMRNPRNWDQVRQDLLRECSIPAFANHKSVWYSKPRSGGKDEGFGIRFVEAALRCMGNVLTEITTLHEDDMRELLRVTITDVQTNNTYPSEFPLIKTVERSRPLDDGSYISFRTNSSGRKTYTVPANEDDLYTKRGAMVSKAIRTVGLRLIPFWLLDEAKDVIMRTRLNDAAQDPDAAIKALTDAFFAIGVSADQVTAYLGHPVANSTPKEIVTLREIYVAVKAGDMTWSDVMSDMPIPERKPRTRPTPQPAAQEQQQAPAAEQPQTQRQVKPQPFVVQETAPQTETVDEETGEILMSDDRTADMFGEAPPPDYGYDPGETSAAPPADPAPQQQPTRRRRASGGME